MTQTTSPDVALAQFVEAYKREHATTAKVLRAFPAEKSELKPHDRSNSARQLAWTFVVEERLMLDGSKGQLALGGGFPKAPESWDQILDMFDAQSKELVSALESGQATNIGGTVGFFAGPGKMADYPTPDFLWFMLCDQIHHRGQLSVYLRMAGGKVPSIYGPSADEPWN